MSVRSSPSSWSGAPPRSFSRPRLVLSAHRTVPTPRPTHDASLVDARRPIPSGTRSARRPSRRQFWLCPRPQRRAKRSSTPTAPLRGRQMPTRRPGRCLGRAPISSPSQPGRSSGSAQAGPQISRHCPSLRGGFFRSSSGTPVTSRSALEPRWKCSRCRGLRRTTPTRATGSSASRVAGSSFSTRMTTPGLRTSLRPRVRMALSSRIRPRARRRGERSRGDRRRVRRDSRTEPEPGTSWTSRSRGTRRSAPSSSRCTSTGTRSPTRRSSGPSA